MISKNIPNNIIESIYERQDYRCLFNLSGCTGRIQGKPHHWGLHNNKKNRRDYYMLVHHPANLAGLCYNCHVKRGSGDNLPEHAILSFKSWIILGKIVTMQFIDNNFRLYADEILFYQGTWARLLP